MRRRPAPTRRRRWAVAAAATALLLLWWLWPAEPPPPVEPPPAVAELPAGKPAPKPGAAEKPKDSKFKTATAAARTPQKQPEVDARALRDAIAQRSKDLEVCNASGAPERLHARLMMSRQGTVKTVALTQSGLVPAAVASCVRDRVRAWTFPELALTSDVDVMVTFSLTPGVAASPSSG